ncbi:hypothetical protein K440DRAFT_644987 [Wilcoxina mikolae CBS 423.85]|nr:hypothetical protein K440DRAFT_644987 [Wilcoxina mikolae CBS 423.85]
MASLIAYLSTAAARGLARKSPTPEDTAETQQPLLTAPEIKERIHKCSQRIPRITNPMSVTVSAVATWLNMSRGNTFHDNRIESVAWSLGERFESYVKPINLVAIEIYELRRLVEGFTGDTAEKKALVESLERLEEMGFEMKKNREQGKALVDRLTNKAIVLMRRRQRDARLREEEEDTRLREEEDAWREEEDAEDRGISLDETLKIDVE